MASEMDQGQFGYAALLEAADMLDDSLPEVVLAALVDAAPATGRGNIGCPFCGSTNLSRYYLKIARQGG